LHTGRAGSRTGTLLLSVPSRPSLFPLSALLAVAAQGCAPAIVPALQPASPPKVPPELAVSSDEELLGKADARGTQVYLCQPGGEGIQEWTLVDFHADLLDDVGHHLGRYLPGPTWEYTDGSKVVGERKRSADSPEPAAAWMLLGAKSTEGAGVLSPVSSILVVDTVGGIAPAVGCVEGARGAHVEVPFRASYYFFKRKA